jgi:hypothetical protein
MNIQIDICIKYSFKKHSLSSIFLLCELNSVMKLETSLKSLFFRLNFELKHSFMPSQYSIAQGNGDLDYV